LTINKKTPILVAFTSDRWEHVCPIIRIVSPAEIAGFQLIRGTEWDKDSLLVFPERVENADLVVLVRDFPSKISDFETILSLAHSKGKLVVYDLDDLLPELPEQHPDVERYRICRPSIIRAILEADAVVGSTATIREYMSQYNQNSWEIPNYLDEQIWNIEALEKKGMLSRNFSNCNSSLVVGFMGGHSHTYDLELIKPTLLNILNRYSKKRSKINISLKFWGLKPPEDLLSWSNVEWINVGMLDYREFASYFQKQTCDLFLAPLQDNIFNQGKSHLKFLEYSALGIPGVYSKISEYQKIVVHGKNGYLASNPIEWEESIINLIEDPVLRDRMGVEAFLTVHSDWILQNHNNAWMDIYENFLSQPKQKPSKFHQLSPEIKNAVQKLQNFQVDLEKELLSINKSLEKASHKVNILQQNLYRIQDQEEILEDQLRESEKALIEKERIAQQYYSLYHQILNTRSWKLLEILAGIRAKIIPYGSFREGILQTLLHSMIAFRNNGVQASGRVAKNEIRDNLKKFSKSQSTSVVQRTGRMPLAPTFFITPEHATIKCLLPVTSILQFDSGNKSRNNLQNPQTNNIINWIQNQTFPSIANIVSWNPNTCEASVINFIQEKDLSVEPTKYLEHIQAPDIQALLRELRTRYICFSSDDLLHQDAAYLETNLIALETELIAFTINLRGHSEWSMQNLHQGRLPGSNSLPFLKQVVVKDCIRNDFSLDLSTWLDQWQKLSNSDNQPADPGFPVLVGKVIVHTTKTKDNKDSYPFDQVYYLSSDTRNHGLYVNGRDILVNLNHNQVNHHPVLEILPHPILAINDRIPSIPEQTEIPTVIVVMPFLAVGGVERITLEIMQQLRERIRWVVVTFEELEPSLGTTADDYRKITPYVYNLPDFIPEIQYIPFMEYLIGRFDPKTIYIANGTTWIYNALGWLKENFPAIRIIDQVYDAKIGWINRYDFSVLLLTDGHIGVNNRICQAYFQKGAKPEQVFLIEDGIDPKELNPTDYNDERIKKIKKNLNLHPSKKVVTFASRLHPQKRPMDFVEIARRCSSDSTMEFLMVGDGPLANTVDVQIRKIGLSNIHRYEFYRPISDILAISDLLVLPSGYEGMPHIILEAQVMGKPVVATDVGNNREVINRTRGGIVVSKIGDISTLMQAVKEILLSPPDPILLRQLTLSYFDLSKVAQKYYRALLYDQPGEYLSSMNDPR